MLAGKNRSAVLSVNCPFLSNTAHDSILYKTKLPFILVFNKTDAQPHEFAIDWMQDFEAFQTALSTHPGSRDAEGEPTYMNSLMNSMSLVLDEFYKHLKAVGVSSMTGAGMKEFFEAVEASRDEYERYDVLLKPAHHALLIGYYNYNREYLPELKRVQAEKEAKLNAAKEDSLARMLADLELDRKRNPAAFENDKWEEEDDSGDEDVDANDNDIIDRSEWSLFFEIRKFFSRSC